jgi:hypothetical protein
MTNASHEGGCLCGAIRYRSSKDPVATSHCHCRSCRLAAGAPAVAWAIFPSDGFGFTAGTPVRHRSSPNVIRTFCGTCGTALTWQHDEQQDTIDITSATLDCPDAFAPTREIWIEQKLAWQTLDTGLPHYLRSSRDSAPVATG